MAKLKKITASKPAEFFYIICLCFFSFFGIWRGADLSDTTYSLGNYMFMKELAGSFNMATAVSNLAGHALLGVSGGNLIIMNFLTRLLPLSCALAVYLFLRKRMDRLVLSAALAAALGLCWCPSVIMYNYLSYFFLTGAVLFITAAFLDKKEIYFFAAGVCLGLNTFVRISNVAELMLVFSVFYGIFLYRKEEKKPLFLKTMLLCIAGYLAGLAVSFLLFLVYIKAPGMDAGSGIFVMYDWISGLLTGAAGNKDSGYSLKIMLMTIGNNYYGNLLYALVYIIPLCAAFIFSKFMKAKEIPGKYCCILYALYTAGLAVILVWFYRRGIFTSKYTNNGSVFRLSVVYLIYATMLFLFFIFKKNADKEERLTAFISLLLIIIAPLGTNNHIFAVINGLFYVLPVSAYLMCSLLKDAGNGKYKVLYHIWTVMFAAVFLMQTMLFGLYYTFRDAEFGGARDYKIKSDNSLKGIYTTEENGSAIDELTDWVRENAADATSLICYGNIPGINYVLGIKPAMTNLWPDLGSFSYEDFSSQLDELSEAEEKPLIIMTAEEADYFGGNGTYSYSRKSTDDDESVLKHMALMEYMLGESYNIVYENEGFTVYKSVSLADMLEELLNDQF
ncbi:MAG: hypothetical protein IKQ88_01080 [Lachnospiraceae bacterium]|nr:hypothetical protein [Lachnospiraceae bacterium]